MFPIKDHQNSGKFPFTNLALIAANIYVFSQQLFSPDPELFITTYALIPSGINFFDPLTLKSFVTSMFLHAGFLHIISNMWFLWIFGDNVEARMGHLKYFGFYILCGVAASVIQYFFIADSLIPMLGASGAIAGVLGAYLKYFPHNSVDTFIPIFGLPTIIAVPAGLMLAYWFFIQLFNGVASVTVTTASVGGIAFIAHVAGFTAGFLTAKLFVW